MHAPFLGVSLYSRKLKVRQVALIQRCLSLLWKCELNCQRHYDHAPLSDRCLFHKQFQYYIKCYNFCHNYFTYWTVIETHCLSLSSKLITFSPPFIVCYVDNCDTSCNILCDLLLFNSDQEPCHARKLSRGKLMFSSEIWEGQAKTQ